MYHIRTSQKKAIIPHNLTEHRTETFRVREEILNPYTPAISLNYIRILTDIEKINNFATYNGQRHLPIVTI